MGETLAETRLEVDGQRAEIEQTVERLRARVRRAIDIPAKMRENPLLYGGLAVGAVFLVAGGPRRLFRAARRVAMPSRADQAYDALPGAMQRWVDALAGAVGPRGDEARRVLAEELQRWRHEPLSRKQARVLAREAADGPPGPSRATWRAVETAATLISAALARRAIERFLSGDRPIEAAAELSPAHTPSSAPSSTPPARVGGGQTYAGWATRESTGSAPER
jgi:hypothetical protein